MKVSKGEESFDFLVRKWKLPPPVRELVFHHGRRWRFDFAWPDWKLAVEIEGIVYQGMGGRHQRAAGFKADLEKYFTAAVDGWTVIRVPPDWLTKTRHLDKADALRAHLKEKLR